MSPLSDVLSRLSDEINSKRICPMMMRCVPINRSSRLSESYAGGDCIGRQRRRDGRTTSENGQAWNWVRPWEAESERDGGSWSWALLWCPNGLADFGICKIVLVGLNDFSSIFWSAPFSLQMPETTSNLLRITLKGRLRVRNESSLERAMSKHW